MDTLAVYTNNKEHAEQVVQFIKKTWDIELEIESFANRYSFKLNPKTRCLINKYQKKGTLTAFIDGFLLGCRYLDKNLHY